MPVLTTVVADTRPVIRGILVHRLHENGRFGITGVYSTFGAGIAAVRRLGPRVAFLPLPRPTERAALGALARSAAPTLVLIGHHVDEASAAFDLGATDFLVPPLTPARVDRTLAFLWDGLRGPRSRVDAGPDDRSAWWPFTDPGGEFLLPLSDVRRLQESRSGTVVHTSGAMHRTSTRFGALVPALARRGFVHVGPGELVRGDAVRELRQVTPDTWELLLEGGGQVRSAPSAREAVRSLMETLGELANH